MTYLPRGRHKLTREEVATVQRSRILRAVVETMAERGYAATPVAEILTRAGVSRETFYQLFTSKQDCFQAAYTDVVASLVEAMTSSPGPVDDRIARFDHHLEVYLEALAADPARARLFLVEVYAAGPQMARHRVRVQQQCVDTMCILLDVTTPAGRFACETLTAAIIGMATNRIVTDDLDGLRALRAPLVDLLRQALSV